MKKLTKTVLFLFGGCASHLMASTAGFTPCPTATLADYMARNSDNVEFSCLLTGPNGGGTMVFGGFGFSQDTSSYTNDQIEVTPVPQGLGGGFSFSLVSGLPFLAAAGQQIEFGINYAWVFPVDPWADAAQLGGDPPFGDFVITESLCVDPFTIPGNVDVGQGCAGGRPTLSIDDTNPPASWTDAIILDPPAAHGETVSLDFLLGGANSPASGLDSLAATNEVVDTLSPEPVSSVLGLGGLIAVVIRRRYRSA